MEIQTVLDKKYYTIKNSKFHIPHHHKQKIYDENVSNLIDAWPSHAKLRYPDEDIIRIVDGRLKVFKLRTAKIPNTTPKPDFLTYLEEYVNLEFKKHSIKEHEYNPVRLQIYREVFDFIISAFRTYKPILAKIKQEYEMNLAMKNQKIRDLEPLKELLWTIQEERDQTVVNIYNREIEEMRELKKENKRLSEQAYEEKCNANTLQVEINKLKADLEEEYKEKKDEVDAKKLLIVELNDLRAEYIDLQNMQNENDPLDKEDVVMLRMALEEAKRCHAEAVEKLTKMKAEYFSVIPIQKYDKLKELYNVFARENEQLRATIREMTDTEKEQNEKYEAMVQQRDFYYLKFKDAQVAKKPEDKVDDLASKVSEGFKKYEHLAGKSQKEITEFILKDLEKDSESAKDKETDKEYDDDVGQGSEESEDVSERKAMLRTTVEMMCDIPPGTINVHFDPMALLPMLLKERDARNAILNK